MTLPVAVPLLPGENVETVLRPHAVSYSGRYLAGGAPLLLALLLWPIFGSSAWATHSAGPWYAFWSHLWGTAIAMHLWMWVPLAATAWLATLAYQHRVWVWYIAIALLASIATAGTSTPLPAGLALGGAAGIVAVEILRQRHKYAFTHLRIILNHPDGSLEKQPLDEVRDTDWSQSLAGRIFGYGRLTLIAGESSKHLFGVHPAARDLTEALILGATGTPALQERGDMERRHTRALAQLGRHSL